MCCISSLRENVQRTALVQNEAPRGLPLTRANTEARTARKKKTESSRIHVLDEEVQGLGRSGKLIPPPGCQNGEDVLDVSSPGALFLNTGQNPCVSLRCLFLFFFFLTKSFTSVAHVSCLLCTAATSPKKCHILLPLPSFCFFTPGPTTALKTLCRCNRSYQTRRRNLMSPTRTEQISNICFWLSGSRVRSIHSFFFFFSPILRIIFLNIHYIILLYCYARYYTIPVGFGAWLWFLQPQEHLVMMGCIWPSSSSRRRFIGGSNPKEC